MTASLTRYNVNSIVLRLLTFGGLGLDSDDGSAAPRLRPPRLALLAALAVAGERGMSRERVMAFFWPDSDEARGRHSLRQALYALRHELGRDVVRSHGATLFLDSAEIATDLAEFRTALVADDAARAASVARGLFLEGFYLPNAPEFERWVEDERTRLATEVTGALTTLASDAAASGDHGAAVEWWRRLTIIDPLSGRFAAGYIEVLAARGDRALALAFVRQHEAVVRRELDADPDPEVRRLEAKLRAVSSTDVTRSPATGTADRPRARESEADGSVTPSDLRAEPAPNVARRSVGKLVQRGAWVVGAVGLLALVATGALVRRQRSLERDDARPVFAVGFIREDGVPDSLRSGRVLTDMLATNLARVSGLSVLANSRLIELMRPGYDSSSGGYIDAARRAGATDVLEGRVVATTPPGLTLEMQRVDLRTGVVARAYRVIANDRYALVDSMTRAIANQLHLISPAGSVADATTSSPMAYRLYEEGLRAYYRFDVKAAQQLMRAALEEDSTFAMAAYYETSLATDVQQTPDGRHVTDARRVALRLALRAPERERLTITADLLTQDQEPRALAVAESLITRYPDDPRALTILGKVRAAVGDWPGAVAATERAIALHSASETTGRANCRLCQDYMQLAEVYLWWDSLAATERTARRFLRAHPSSHQPWWLLTLTAMRTGDSTRAYESLRRLVSIGGADRAYKLHVDLALGEYDVVERGTRELLASSSPHDWGNGAWLYLIALRNQGRLREATLLHRSGSLPGLPPAIPNRPEPDFYNAGILALERGDARASAAAFARHIGLDMSRWSPGVQARNRAWIGTLQGMALAAADDTLAVRALADSVEAWGRGSLYGRDPKSHHYLRGLLLVAERRDEDAVREFQAAIYSPSLGFTRVNYELARTLMRLGRPGEAVTALQPALRGEIDASNLYLTRTEIHELLAQAFDSAGVRDSAAVHYRAVAKAWERADPAFHARRAAAERWLARYATLPQRPRAN